MENESNGLKDLKKYIDAAQHKKVLVVGDLMLDRYIYGAVNRISPESDAPVLDVRRTVQMPGGAGNVVANLQALGLRTYIVALCGDDKGGAFLKEALGDSAPGIVMTAGRPTTRKTRYVSGAGQHLRVDEEVTSPADQAERSQIIDKVARLIEGSDIMILSDYNKGVLSAETIPALIKLANDKNVPVLVDPKKDDYRIYAGANMVTPNRKELAAATGMPAGTDEEITAAAKQLMRDCGFAQLVVTRSEDGMSVFEKGEDPVHIRHDDIAATDVSGAGDTAIAGLALGLATGASLAEAAQIANRAGGVVVGKTGTASIDPEELKGALDGKIQAQGAGLDTTREALVCDNEKACAVIKGWQEQGLQVGFTNGCFDILHYGHVNYLNRARDYCDRLVVGLNHDQSVKILKGPERPLHDQKARASVIGGLGAVDMVVFFGAEKAGEDNTPCALIEQIKPDIYFKGGDYTIDQLPEAKIMESIGGRVQLMDLYKGHSTTATIEKMKKDDQAA